MSNQALLEKLNQTSELLSVKLAELVKLASMVKDDDNVEYEQAMVTNGLMMVNNQTLQLIRGVQDLILLTRSIREKWLLTQIPEQQQDQEVDHEELTRLLESCVNEIITNE
ncbi:Mediator of RNA polymerase II transcription subunit 22 [Nakaseomyces bracarensis]|uniref:Mediator of RNA polymerase II transcription subunit 22 n=1 Tax=Nakaseomyces bracarensis TaxID=273131 RepID=A0ABR4P0R6_9SACH